MNRKTRNITFTVLAGVAIVATAFTMRSMFGELRRYVRIRRM